MMGRADTLAVLRVDLGPEGFPGHSVLIVPDSSVGPGFRDFYRVSRSTADAVFMFGCFVESDADAVELALANGPEYIW